MQISLHKKIQDESSSQLLQQLVDSSRISEKEALKEIDETLSVEEGLRRIRKLDLILQKKLQQAKDLNNKVVSASSTNISSTSKEETVVEKVVKIMHNHSEDVPKSNKDFLQRNKDLGTQARFVTLTREEEQKVEAILKDPLYNVCLFMKSHRFHTLQES